jgi:hypothetical protein
MTEKIVGRLHLFLPVWSSSEKRWVRFNREPNPICDEDEVLEQSTLGHYILVHEDEDIPLRDIQITGTENN